MILAIDPGTTVSTTVSYHPDFPEFTPGEGGPRVIDVERDVNNLELVTGLRRSLMGKTVVIEEVESFGMPVGRDVFQTVRWSGRMEEAIGHSAGHCYFLPRREVKLHLCGSARAKDGNIRQALLDRFGDGSKAAVGTKKNPGPLFGVAGHAWSALALAVTWADLHSNKEE